ncbi:MAG: bifunctional diguanylate cyclase/phosphodiesterase [Lachnospiraceae bacterium]|nr:bifunctional diguanylate cyclase/phosphodiesterase [Lachnospiraceae bacterium]
MIYFIIFVLIAILVCVIFYLRDQLKWQHKYYKDKTSRLAKEKNQNKGKIEELEKSVEDLNETAYRDVTTKIGNRDYFIANAIELLKKECDYTLVGFGISNIATINRLYGPAEGDKAVCFAARILEEVVNHRGIYAHVQSNLFAILMKTNQEEHIQALMEEITEKMLGYSDIFRVEVQFGVYYIQDHTEKVSEILSRMVLAQRSIPRESPVNYGIFNEELNRKFEENKKMCAEMEQALDDHKFVMYLQPMVDLHQYYIYSAEALVRWEHEERGLLSPYAFLPVFENTNLMLKLDYYMWEEACKTIRRWIDNKMEPLPLMLNISPIHLNSDGFIDILSKLLERYKLKKEMLVLELPERALTTGENQVKDHIQILSEKGFRLSIDNFGSMHSPVNLLRDLPISMVKLDRRFLNDNVKSEEGLTILRYLIAMAKELDLTVVTEGVETMEQANFLTEIGCDIAQGYFFSKPVSLRDFDQLNKKISRLGFQPNEYYPTFSDMENGVDIMEKMLKGSQQK